MSLVKDISLYVNDTYNNKIQYFYHYNIIKVKLQTKII